MQRTAAAGEEHNHILSGPGSLELLLGLAPMNALASHLIYTREIVLSSSIILQKAVELKITAQETHLKRGKGSLC